MEGIVRFYKWVSFTIWLNSERYLHHKFYLKSFLPLFFKQHQFGLLLILCLIKGLLFIWTESLFPFFKKNFLFVYIVQTNFRSNSTLNAIYSLRPLFYCSCLNSVSYILSHYSGISQKIDLSIRGSFTFPLP